MITLKLSKRQAEILENKLSQTLAHLEDNKLTDADCYLNLKPLLYDLRRAMSDDEQNVKNDLESELGISLDILNKMRHSKEVYLRDDKGEIVIGYIDSINIRKYMFVGRYKGISDIKQGFRVNFRWYGSKIALTKEELEK